MQYVQVKFPETDRWYSYQWDGERPMEIGDKVVVPPTYLSEYPSFARVVALGRNPNYDGPLKSLMGVVDESE